MDKHAATTSSEETRRAGNFPCTSVSSIPNNLRVLSCHNSALKEVAPHRSVFAAEVDCLNSYVQICADSVDVFMQDGSEKHISLTREEAKSLGAALLIITSED